ncbi:predicted protein [Sclerotinia sclerotiorum 1980 UF-70]|uniref:Uncharacterized protein n=1 Tax=Sclerotinia sclerotiorum (strain ATCC 18683 / 1980 / Ss-1) TaxID=665079 RepID=A7F333_SCLS1|nr:predicted protein [Sclerotinia sclerotiorum 1980 UF-70]EDN96125.1 predicted protein [Sclerotinia sclerotiorum 1980 UF-70]
MILPCRRKRKDTVDQCELGTVQVPQDEARFLIWPRWYCRWVPAPLHSPRLDESNVEDRVELHVGLFHLPDSTNKPDDLQAQTLRG